MTTIERLLAEAMELSETERAELASRISATVPDADTEAAWREEVTRRAAEHDVDDSGAMPWDEAMEAIFAPIARR